MTESSVPSLRGKEEKEEGSVTAVTQTATMRKTAARPGLLQYTQSVSMLCCKHLEFLYSMTHSHPNMK